MQGVVGRQRSLGARGSWAAQEMHQDGEEEKGKVDGEKIQCRGRKDKQFVSVKRWLREAEVASGDRDGRLRKKEERTMVRKYNEGDVDETREEEENMKVEKRKERERKNGGKQMEKKNKGTKEREEIKEREKE